MYQTNANAIMILFVLLFVGIYWFLPKILNKTVFYPLEDHITNSRRMAKQEREGIIVERLADLYGELPPGQIPQSGIRMSQNTAAGAGTGQAAEPEHLMPEDAPDAASQQAEQEDAPCFCGQCGSRNNSGDMFCGKCGAPLRQR